MSIITPTIGRQVWFRGIPWSPDSNPGKTPTCLDIKQPMAATIVYVWTDRSVNLDVIDHAGVHWPLASVTLEQPGDAPRSQYTAYAEWMPHQIGQAQPVTSMFEGLVASAEPAPYRLADAVMPGTGQLSRRLQ